LKKLLLVLCLFGGIVSINANEKVTQKQIESEKHKCLEEKNMESCGFLGFVYNQEGTKYRDPSLSTKYLTMSCDGGLYHSCFFLGTLLVSEKKNMAINSFKKGCKGGDTESCGFLGMLYLAEGNSDKVLSEGVSLLEGSCQKDTVIPCSLLFDVYMKGITVDKNPKKAIEFAKKACDLGSRDDCYNLGYFYLKGSFVKQNKNTSKMFLTKGCALGDDESCKRLKQLKTKKEEK